MIITLGICRGSVIAAHTAAQHRTVAVATTRNVIADRLNYYNSLKP